jgi:hypothetical protein
METDPNLGRGAALGRGHRDRNYRSVFVQTGCSVISHEQCAVLRKVRQCEIDVLSSGSRIAGEQSPVLTDPELAVVPPAARIGEGSNKVRS